MMHYGIKCREGVVHYGYKTGENCSHMKSDKLLSISRKYYFYCIQRKMEINYIKIHEYIYYNLVRLAKKWFQTNLGLAEFITTISWSTLTSLWPEFNVVQYSFQPVQKRHELKMHGINRSIPDLG